MARIHAVSRCARMSLRRTGLAITIAALPIAATPLLSSSAVAATDERESPRVAMTIGPVGIVVIAANNKLYAFLDRSSDNAPVPGGKVRIKGAKFELGMSETAPGVYRSGPFSLAAGPTRLTVSVESALGTGSAVADLVGTTPVMPQTVEGRLRPYWYALGVLALGGLGWLGWRDRRRRQAVPLAGAGTV